MANNSWPSGAQGFPCPQCGQPFRLTAAELLAADQFTCAGCGLVLTLAKEQSGPALNQLRAYQQTMEQITATVPGQSGTTKPR